MASFPALKSVDTDDVDTNDAISVPPSNVFNVRGPSYLVDKVKVPATAPMFQCVHVEGFRLNSRLDHVASDPRSYLQARRAAGDNGEYCVVVYQAPSSSWASEPSARYHAVIYFRRDPAGSPSDAGSAETSSVAGGAGGGAGAADSAGGGSAGDAAPAPAPSPATDPASAAAFERVWKRFKEGSDEYRAARWKVFPHLAQGPWMVSTAMGTRPAILATKLQHRFFTGEGYVEVDCDVGASLSYLPAISTIIGLLQSEAARLVIDLAIGIEPQTEEELPESLLGVVRLHRINPTKADVLPSGEGSDSGKK